MNPYTRKLSEDVRNKLFKLQDLIDTVSGTHKFNDGNYLDFCRLMSDEDGKGLYQNIMKMIELLNGENGILARTRTARNVSDRLTRAEVIERAHDPENPQYIFCPKCSRPMNSNYLKQHQRDSFICREVKIGRIATQQLGNRTSRHIGNIIARDLPTDENDSDVEEEP